MRPYKIPHTSRWVDLDTIQSIDEPVLGAYENCILQWHHAFRDKPDEVNFGREEIMPDPKRQWSATTFREEMERLVAIWRKQGAKKYYREVFVPFFTAWAGRPPTDFQG